MIHLAKSEATVERKTDFLLVSDLPSDYVPLVKLETLGPIPLAIGKGSLGGFWTIYAVNIASGASIVGAEDKNLFEAAVRGNIEGVKLFLDKGARTQVLGANFFGDRNQVSYCQSVTALTLARAASTDRKMGDQMLVIADPVFELKDERAQSAAQTKVAEADKEHFENLMATIEDSTKGSFRFKRLPETTALAHNLAKLYGDKVEKQTGLAASKTNFLGTNAQDIGKYRWLVFATHGLFSKQIPGLTEPFLALTLVPPGTDGFLTMSDVMTLKMSADLVALTACQTGLGKELSGEGVMSMGRAFQYAGARSVLMSLWSVSEKSSVMLVEYFFRDLKGGKTKLEVLKLARDEIRKAGYDHLFTLATLVPRMHIFQGFL